MAQPMNIEAGLALPPLAKGPYTSSHLVRWCAAQQNWDKIHYDRDFAIGTAGLPERVINGALKQHVIVQFLTEAFPEDAWIWTIQFRFLAPDLIGESLEVRGTIASVDAIGDQTVASVDIEIWNTSRQKLTTSGTARIGLGAGGVSLPPFPAELRAAHAARPAGDGVPQTIAGWIGTDWERLSSDYPVDLSRLRLFADAIGNLSPIHFDPVAAAASIHGRVVAPPLFPLHALEARPDTLALSDDPTAIGREGVNEMGRNLGRRLGLPGAGMVNGGSDIEIHGRLYAGETVRGVGRLLAADLKSGRGAEPMLITKVLNDYFTGDRLLVRELQTTIYRNISQ
ncbi:FAS1-like dehydratase domain-containing protein [Aquabacter spiritensis]|uniref:Acyl dehydratase n=1 Tax=Aquabacter spiritensis TaxID=933073 RepID=A0A4R3LMU3_9HYPH|nr:MaoC family dehydratase N-terminal domain-containing protein [Aquabacter spiritensis]TCT01713.1 acyl dehydratase [Aquabacter spiritensis]